MHASVEDPDDIRHRGFHMTNILKGQAVQNLLDRASGVNESGGNARLKVITRDLLEAIMAIWKSTMFREVNSGRR